MRMGRCGKNIVSGTEYWRVTKEGKKLSMCRKEFIPLGKGRSRDVCP